MGPNLRRLELPHNCMGIPVLRSILDKCTNLDVLLFKGEPRGFSDVNIFHPRLRKLEFQSRYYRRSLFIECPNLTHLSTETKPDNRRHAIKAEIEPPEIDCPNLTNLCLSPLHCDSDILKTMAERSPGIKVFHGYLTETSPISNLTHFKA